MLQIWSSERVPPGPAAPVDGDRIRSVSAWPLDGVTDAVVTTDERLVVRSWNHAAGHLLGRGAADAIGRPLAEVLATDLAPEVRREVTMGLVVHGRWAGTIAATDADGLPVALSLSLCLLRGADDGPPGIVAVMRPAGHDGDWDDTRSDDGEETHREPGLPGAFVMHYQPEVDLDDGRVVACEALLRWHHPGLGLLAPGGFLGEPRSASRMAALGAWTLFAACRRAAEWWAREDPVRVILNLSPPQLDDAELALRVRRATTVTGARPGSMGAELSAALLAAEPARATRVAWDLADAGLVVGLDDVTGLVDDHVLARLPIENLKLDRSLTAGIDQRPAQQAEVASVVDAARGLGLAVTAEGVETLAELDQLRSLGCDRAFGFLLVPPLPAARIDRLLGHPVLPAGLTRF